ncbi:MAG TPA: FHA domain-containing protein [Roseiflexaceae bacterium]
MTSGHMLVTHPDGREQAIPLRDGRLRIGSAPDNDLVIAGPGIAPHHAIIRFDDRGDLIISIAGCDLRGGSAGLEIDLPRAFAPAVLARVAGHVLSFQPERSRTTRPLSAAAIQKAGSSAPADDGADLLYALLQQDDVWTMAMPPAQSDSHEAITLEMPALSGPLRQA